MLEFSQLAHRHIVTVPILELPGNSQHLAIDASDFENRLRQSEGNQAARREGTR